MQGCLDLWQFGSAKMLGSKQHVEEFTLLGSLYINNNNNKKGGVRLKKSKKIQAHVVGYLLF